MTQFDLWNLSKLASAAEDGWFFTRVDENTRILVHAGDRCTRTDCPDRDWAHTHEPKPEHTAEMWSYVRRYRAARNAATIERIHQKPTQIPDTIPVPRTPSWESSTNGTMYSIRRKL